MSRVNQQQPAQPTESIEQVIDRLCVKIPDHPDPGILFRDLTPLFADSQGFTRTVDSLAEAFEGQFDCVAGVEARGFILAGAVARSAGCGVLPVRKEGKLPRETYRQSYQLEYGSATLEIHTDDLARGSRVLVVDDLLATGGTLEATGQLLHRAGLHIAGFGLIMELTDLRGRAKLGGHRVRALYRV
ncbi:adenine phosphoribosyltransferase [Kocuria sp. JC486]|uniref:Adenine phosphoribosyltransferase n=1 Tax=Kocuria soli TaxID=2485125 RepID=A0A3N4A2F7_9MICC|nr:MULTISPECIES: adenine phosphoribosyltransferase [Kocuria]NHU85205.1 adenine phosphoribosyltransferase [Kocuria sp. JC486]ROZ62524.1 adenine phosphoribosyltransferase [Kocuria soli]